MAFSDLRTFIEAAGDIGEAKTVDGAHWNLEIGCLTELMAEQEGPLLLFDNIPGYPKGFRIATNVLATARRFALALGLPTELPKLEILEGWREKNDGTNQKGVRSREVQNRNKKLQSDGHESVG